MATTNTNLISVVQDAIDNRTSTATKAQLVALRALAEKLLMTNQAGLDTEVQADIDALTNASSIPDIIRTGMAATFTPVNLGGGDLGKFMPLTICRATELYLKSGQTTTVNSLGSDFWGSGLNNLTAKYGGYTPYIKTDAVNNNLEQQIMSIPTGKGVLTHVITPECSGIPVIKIRIVADGEEYLFEVTSISTAARLCLGGILDQFASTNGSATGAGVGSYWDAGFNTNVRLLIKPDQAIQKGIGLTFENSLEVYFQCVSGSVSTTAEYKNAYVVVADNIPLGFEK